MFLHIRFSPVLLEWVKQVVQDLKSPLYVISREYGSQLQGEHHHMAVEVPIGVEAIKKRFQTVCKSLGLITLRGQENKYYGGVKECTCVPYICKDGDVIASSGYSPEQLAELIAAGKKKYRPDLPIVAVNSIAEPGPVSPLPLKRKSESMRAKFVKYLKQELQWKEKSSISLDTWQDSRKKLVDMLTEFWENAFTTPQAVVCIEHARWVFGDDDIRDLLKSKRYASINNMLC